LKKTKGRMKSLNLGASVAPRMAQAASHGQVSSIEISRCAMIFHFSTAKALRPLKLSLPLNHSFAQLPLL
jgi:hypothetical protein